MKTLTVTTEFKWKLNNFKNRFLSVDGSANSELFSLNDGSGAKFQIQISGQCCIRLFCKDFGQNEEIKLDATFWIQRISNKFGKSVQSCTFKKAGNIVKSEDFLPADIYNILKTQISNGKASICFEIKQEIPVPKVSVQQTPIREVVKEPEVYAHDNIKEAILDLHEDSTLITIKAEEKEVKIFKRFLVRHSEIFEKMLTMQNSTEAQSGIITMENVKPTIVEAMRDWMYMGKIENFDEIASALFKIAHKYMIAKLKEECVRSMCRGLNWQNVPALLILAHQYDEDLLKQRTLGFIRIDIRNLRHLIKSDDWLDFCESDRELTKEIVDSIYS